MPTMTLAAMMPPMALLERPLLDLLSLFGLVVMELLGADAVLVPPPGTTTTEVDLPEGSLAGVDADAEADDAGVEDAGVVFVLLSAVVDELGVVDDAGAEVADWDLAVADGVVLAALESLLVWL